MNSTPSCLCFSIIGSCLTAPFRYLGCLETQNTNKTDQIISSTASTVLSSPPVVQPLLTSQPNLADQTLDTLLDINGASLRSIIQNLCITALSTAKSRRSSFFQQREVSFISHLPNIAIHVKRLIDQEYEGVGSNIEFLGDGKYSMSLTPVASLLEAHVSDEKKRKQYPKLQEIFNQVYASK